MYAEILAISISSVVELLVSGFLGVSAPYSAPLNYAISIYFLVIPMIILPALIFIVFLINKKELHEEELK